MSDPVPTPVLRPPTRAEKAWLVVAAVLMLGVTVWYVVLPRAPAPSVWGPLGLGMMVGGAVGVLVEAGELRPDSGRWAFPRLQSLTPQATRRQLRRELWAGRPGPAELWPFAWGWAARRVTRRRSSPPAWFFIAGVQLVTCYAFSDPLPWWTAVVPVVCVLAGIGETVLNRRAMRIAQTLARGPGPGAVAGADGVSTAGEG